jgi:single-stranded-DNA-specific exonuclease
MNMDEIRIEKFREAMKETAASLADAPGREITVVHHNDTDGITSGAILRKSLMRSGFSVENIPIERVHPAFLPVIHTPGRRLILYADLGGQAADVISRHIPEDSRVIIIDHHLPAAGSFPRLRQVNPELFGIDGDSRCAAAAAACFFALALDGGNEDLAALAVLGAVGDHQMAEGRFWGLNALLLETAAARGDLRPEGADEASGWLFPRFGGRSLREADRLILSLAVNGYYRRGADLAIDACLNGPDERMMAFSAEMALIQEDRFGREIARIRREGLQRQAQIVWRDVGERFHPLGLKAIGLFCEAVIRNGVADGEGYVVGFQHFPGENPYLGRFPGREAKVSFRVTPGLKRSIERGERPDLMRLVPEAVQQVGGFAEACHRFAAACTIPEDRIPDLVGLLADRAGCNGVEPQSTGC